MHGLYLFSVWIHILAATVWIGGMAFLVSAVHDFVVGPRATAAIAANPGSSEAQIERRRASVLGRTNVLLALALALVGAGVMLVRGVPW